MTWIIDFVDYEAVETMCRKRFGMSPYVDEVGKKICQKLLMETDKVQGDTLYQAKRNLIRKIGNNRIEILGVTTA